MRAKTTEKYYNALKDLEFQCKMMGNVNGKTMAAEHNITRGFISYATKNNIVKKTSYGYEWKAGKVTMPMAKKLQVFINSQINPEIINKKETKQREPQKNTTPKAKQKTTETISILWGLYTKTITK